MSDRIGTSFQWPEVAELYLKRPPYPARIFELLAEAAPACGRLLDLGAGHGKVARPMTRLFDEVTAIDPSAELIRIGQTLEGGDAPNLTWVEAYAEDAPLTGQYDLAVAALAIHWMDHDRLFPHLRTHLAAPFPLAVIEGDAAHQPPWHDAWREFLKRWVPELTGEPLHEEKGPSKWESYLPHVDVQRVHEVVSDPLQQSIEDFILCQHSRDTFAISKLGTRRARFDDELRDLLTPYAEAGEMLTFRSYTKLTLAHIKP